MAAADDLSLSIAAGTFVAVTGASGSGKSTLLHLIGAIERPDRGSITSDGTELTRLRGAAPGRLPAHRRFRVPALQPAARADRAGQRDRPGAAVPDAWNKRDRARELLDAVGLAGREQSLPARMSGGEQQRVAIARALINHPSLLLADEPTGNLDTQNAAEIMALLTRLRATRGMTIVLASHDMQIAARSERLIRLRDGVLEQDIDLTEGYPVQDVIRRASQLG